MALQKDLTEPQVDLRSKEKIERDRIKNEKEKLIKAEEEVRVKQKMQAEKNNNKKLKTGGGDIKTEKEEFGVKKEFAQDILEKDQIDGESIQDISERSQIRKKSAQDVSGGGWINKRSARGVGEETRINKKSARGTFGAADESLARDSEAPMVPEGEYVFPDGFLWGTSTSAYQVEGGIKNDWSEWETSEKRLAELEKKGEKMDDFICGQAVDHYHRYKEDLSLAAGLNNNAIRIGLEWARIQPKKDTWDVTAINHYKKVLDTAHDKGLKTVVTLWHWTNPLWLSKEGGWENGKAKEYFGEYVDFIIQELGGEIDYWVTLNEPLMHVFGGYLRGYFPPAKHSIFKAEKVFQNLVKGHKLAYEKIHKHFPMANVSLTALVNYFEAANFMNPIEQGIAKAMHYYWNHRFLSKTKKYLDYIGLDYYFHDRIIWYPPFRRNRNERVNDKGWEIYPEGILAVLRYLNGFKKPIIILENGLADAHDRYRANFIREHLYYIYKAMEEGVDVRGYFHWSLLDNFEWAYGWSPKFGLYLVDRKTFERKEKPSADVYREICGSNKVVVL